MKLIIELVSDPILWLMLCACALLFFKIVRKSNYFNITQIVKMHINAFRNDSGKINKMQFGIAFIIPGILAVAIASMKIIDSDTINMLTVIISILTSMFFTLLAMIIDIKGRWNERKEKDDSSEITIMASLMRSLYYAIMFEILLSIILLILCFIAVFTTRFSYMQSILIYWLSITVIMNLFMVLKRIFLVIERSMK